ncbi:hypothetical protein ACFRKB_27385 [Streptomyces scopuliridis]
MPALVNVRMSTRAHWWSAVMTPGMSAGLLTKEASLLVPVRHDSGDIRTE